ncbi:flagellar motor protein MotA [Thalassospiraceae bacterium LMO-JJ14]|nr:flagellar motor protein MotA [Thalassospiraceae bacterium LMO-JJ14]
MTRPTVFLFRMIAFLGCVAAACFFVFDPLKDAFLANAALNGLILGVLVLGIFYNFRQVALLYPEVSWLDSFRDTIAETDAGLQIRLPESRDNPKLLAPMATMLSDRRGSRFSLSALSMRSILDGIAARLDESRDLSRYNIGLLIFLGLLGTFWGLLETVGSIGEVIGGLNVDGGETALVFEKLKTGLEAPIDGMGTAFSSSLFGLAGSLVLGFLDLQASQSQNRFFNELEEWLSSVTRLSSGALGAEGEQGVPAYVQALLEQTAESLENLQVIISRSEEGKHAVNHSLSELANKVETLTDHMRTEQAVMRHLAETQVEMKPILERLANGSVGNNADEVMSGHLRNVDKNMQRLVDESALTRNEITDALRREIRLLARTIAATGDSN